MKIQKKKNWRGGRVGVGCQIGRVRVGVNEKVKILLKLKKKSEGGVGIIRVGEGGSGRCERRIEVIVN